MKTRNIKLFNKTIPLIPLIAALMIGGVVVGLAAPVFLNLILSPYQQRTHDADDPFTVVVAPKYVVSSLIIEGEGEEGELIIGCNYDLTLSISHTKPDFEMSGQYILTITGLTSGEDVMTGAIADLRFGDPFVRGPESWSPSETGSFTAALSMTGLSWLEVYYATFSGVSFVKPEGTLSLDSHTLLLGERYEVGTLVDFDFTVRNDHSENMNEFSYDVETSDGSTWTSAVSGIVEEVMAPDATKIVDADFDAPPTEGTYEVRIIISGINTDVFVTFTGLTVEIEPHSNMVITFVSSTLTIGTPILEGTLVDFDYTLYNDVPSDGANPRGWLYDVDVSTDGGSTWTTVGTGKVYDAGTAYLTPPPDTHETFEADFTAPSIDGDCQVRLRIYDIRGTGEGEPGTV